MNNNNRGRFPPGIGAAGPGLDPNFQSRNPNPNPQPQQYLQSRTPFPQQPQTQPPQYLQSQPDAQQSVQQAYPQQFQQQQQQQQQQWSRRAQLPSDPSYVDEVEKTVQSEANNDSK